MTITNGNSIGSLIQFEIIPQIISLAGRNTLIALGDSITVGQGASISSEGYIQQFSTTKGLTLTNFAIGGRGVWAEYNAVKGAGFTRSQTLITSMTGFNDMRRNGASTRTLKKIEAGYRCVLLKGMALTNTPSGSASVTRTGSFTSYAGDTVGGVNPVGTIPGNVATFNTLGAAATWTWSFSGTSFGIQFFSNDGTGSTVYGEADILVDDVVIKRVNCSEWYDGISDGSYDNKRGPVALTFHGFSNAVHTVKFQSVGNGVTPLDFFASLNTSDNSCAFLFAEMPYATSAGYDAVGADQGSIEESDIASTIIKSLVDEYRRLDYHIAYVKTNNYYSSVNTTDGVHPNDLGHDQITNAFVAATV